MKIYYQGFPGAYSYEASIEIASKLNNYRLIAGSCVKKNITLKKAGYSKILDQLVCNLLSNLEEITKFQEKEFEFISIQRIKFFRDSEFCRGL